MTNNMNKVTALFNHDVKEIELDFNSSVIPYMLCSMYAGGNTMVEVSIEFVGGRWYGYELPKALFIEMVSAPSIGRFYNAHIKGKFVSIKL